MPTTSACSFPTRSATIQKKRYNFDPGLPGPFKRNDAVPYSERNATIRFRVLLLDTHTLQTKRILPATIPVVLATALVTVLALALAVAVTIAVVGVVDAVVLVVVVVVVVVVVASGLMPGRPPLLASRFF